MPLRLRATRRSLPGGEPIKRELGRYKSLFFPASDFFPADAENDVIAYRGLLLATVEGGLPESDMTTSQEYYVPWSPGALYGTGSDTCVGILRETLDATYTDHVIAAVNRGDAIEMHCYEGGNVDANGNQIYGTISAAAKTQLTLIKWL